jgi:hypothetical protein
MAGITFKYVAGSAAPKRHVPGPFGSRNPIAPVASGQKVTILVGELEQGGSDLNGDGDAGDHVSIVIHVRNLRAKIEK